MLRSVPWRLVFGFAYTVGVAAGIGWMAAHPTTAGTIIAVVLGVPVALAAWSPTGW